MQLSSRIRADGIILALALTLTTPNLLLQHNAVDTGLEQREDQARLALQHAQAVEHVRGRRRGQSRERVGQLQSRSIH